MDAKQEVPGVYRAILAVAADMAREGIGKTRQNVQQGYKFRGIDEVLNALAPSLVAHGLVILPRCIGRVVTERATKTGGILIYVVVEAEFDFVAISDGSKHTVKTYGEAMDSGDKATNKAMSAAYKYAAFQAFCIPIAGEDNDADATTHEVTARAEALKDGLGDKFAGGTAAQSAESQEQAAPLAALGNRGASESTAVGMSPPDGNQSPDAPISIPPPCPKCHGEMWNNCAKRAQDEVAIAAGVRVKKPRAAWSCKDKACGGTYWPADPNEANHKGGAAGVSSAQAAPASEAKGAGAGEKSAPITPAPASPPPIPTAPNSTAANGGKGQGAGDLPLPLANNQKAEIKTLCVGLGWKALALARFCEARNMPSKFTTLTAEQGDTLIENLRAVVTVQASDLPHPRCPRDNAVADRIGGAPGMWHCPQCDKLFKPAPEGAGAGEKPVATTPALASAFSRDAALLHIRHYLTEWQAEDNDTHWLAAQKAMHTIGCKAASIGYMTDENIAALHAEFQKIVAGQT